MPVFKVIQGDDAGSARYFAYQGGQARLGEPTPFTVESLAVESDDRGQPVGVVQWVIKESASGDQRERFTREYDRLCDLAEETARLTGGPVFTPQPVYLLERLDTGAAALALPYYSRTMHDVAATIDEARLVTQIMNYAMATLALHQVDGGSVCLLREPDDLRWRDDRIMIVAWEGIRPLTDASVAAELPLLGRVWYRVLTGHEAPLVPNPWHDVEWQRTTGTAAPDRIEGGVISIGLRLLLTRALRGGFESLEQVKMALQSWQDQFLKTSRAPNPQSAMQQEQVQADFGLSSRQTRVLLHDLVWRASPTEGNWQVRAEALDSLLRQPDELATVQASFETLTTAIRSGRYDTAHATLDTLTTDRPVEQLALARWTRLLAALESPELAANQKNYLQRESAALVDAVRRLQQPIDADRAAESLTRLEDAVAHLAKVTDFLDGTVARKHLLTLLREAEMRAALLAASAAYQAGDRPTYSRALSQARDASVDVPGVDVVLDGFDLGEQLGAAQRVSQARQKVETQVQEVLTVLVRLLQDDVPPSELAQVRSMLNRIESELTLTDQRALEAFVSATRPYARLLDYLDTAPTAAPDEAARDADDLRRLLSADIWGLVSDRVTRTVRDRADETLRQVERALDAGSAESLRAADRLLPTVAAESVKAYLDEPLCERVRQAETRLASQHEFFDWFANHFQSARDLEIVERARANAVPLFGETVRPHVEKAIRAAASDAQGLQTLLNEYRDEMSTALRDLQTEQQTAFDDLRQQIDAVRTESRTEPAAVKQLQAELTNLREQNEQLETRLHQRATRASVRGTFATLLLLLVLLLVAVGALAALYVLPLGAQIDSIATAAAAADRAANSANVAAEVQATQVAGMFVRATDEAATRAAVAAVTATVLTQQPTVTPTDSPTTAAALAVTEAATAEVTADAQAVALADGGPTNVIEAALVPAEVSDFAEFIDDIPEVTYELVFPVIDNSELPDNLPVSAGSALQRVLFRDVLPALENLDGTVSVRLVMRAAADGLFAVPVIALEADAELTQDDGTSQFLPEGSYIIFDNDGMRRVFTPLPADVDTTTGMIQVSAAVRDRLESALGVRVQFVTLPEVGDVLPAQIDDQGRIAALLLDEGQVSFMLSTASGGPRGTNIRSLPNETGLVRGGLGPVDGQPLVLPGQADPADLDTVSSDDFIVEIMLRENRIAVPEQSANADLFTWYLVELTRLQQAIGATSGWVRGDLISINTTEPEPDAPLSAPLPVHFVPSG